MEAGVTLRGWCDRAASAQHGMHWLAASCMPECSRQAGEATAGHLSRTRACPIVLHM